MLRYFPCSREPTAAGLMIDEKLLEERLAALEAARPWSPRVVSRLETLLRSGDETAVFRINPIRFAAEKGMSEAEAIDLFLHGTVAGLFEMDWLLLCPMCSDIVDSFRSLRTVHRHYHCHLCHSDYEAVLDDYIAVTFSVLPVVRRVRFHNPASLPVTDYAFLYKATSDGLTPEGVPWADVIKSSMKALQWLAPGETARLELDAAEGMLLGVDMESDAHFDFTVTGDPAKEIQRVLIDFGADICSPDAGTVKPGRTLFEVRNTTANHRAVFGVLQVPAGGPPLRMLQFKPFLSGKRLLMTQTFRDFFRSEVIRGTEGLAVRDITVLFTDLKGSTALYERIGDLNAYVQVQRHFEQIVDVTVRHQGAVTKTIGDAVMAAFLTPADAVRAALEMRQAIEPLNRDRPQRDFVLKIGIHKGASIAVTLNDRLDYFGQTVNIAARVQHLADGDEIVITENVRQGTDMSEILAPYRVDKSTAELKGITGSMSVYFVRGAAA
jgi:class 3 adenylate cyclase